MKFAVYLIMMLVFSVAKADDKLSFFRAVNVDDVGTVHAVLARGLDPNTADERGQVALFLALRDESPRVAAALLAHPQIRIDATNASGETPLMMAALRGQLDWAGKLLDRGAQLNRPGWTPLHYAASGPEPKMVLLLLDRGAAIDAGAANRTTALMMAARYGAQESAELLLLRGADARPRNDAGLTAADFARAAGRDALATKLQAAAVR